MNTGKLNKLQSQVRIGGKGTPRRKVKKTGGSHGAGGAGGMDDLRKVQSCMKKTPIQPIPMIEEVNMFRDDGKIIHFQSPKVHAAIASNMFTMSGTQAQEKELTELMPGILTQLGAESLNSLKALAEQYQSMQVKNENGESVAEASEKADEDVPELVENFEEVA